MEFTIKMGAQAGAGIMTIGRLMLKCFTRGGYNALGYPEYPSLIRGGHNAVQVRMSDEKIYAPTQTQDILIALNKDAIFYHMANMHKGGCILYDDQIDPNALVPLKGFKMRSDVRLFQIPLSKLAQEVGATEQMKNTAALGGALALIDYPFDVLEGIINDELARKGADVISKNVSIARAGYDQVKSKGFAHGISIKPRSKNPLDRQILVAGNEAIALGAVAGGCRFYSAYPMTPATSILHFLTEKERDLGIVTKQTEDEIAAILYAVGASFAGVRAMTGTSGGGFSLMVETLSLAALSEVPLVIILVQRPGPATCLPTSTEQAELRFAIHAAHGEFPRVVLAPGDVDECFSLTAEAHNIAERYQIQVIVLSDKFLSETTFSSVPFDSSKIKIDRGKLIGLDAFPLLPQLQAMERYSRYQLTPDGISPRTLPGAPNGIHVATSYEHSENGSSTENFHMRARQVEKRGKLKLAKLECEIPAPNVYGSKVAEATIVCWGSTKLPALDAMKLLADAGVRVRVVHFNWLFPLDQKKVVQTLGKGPLICIESNSTAQLAGLLKEYAGIEMDFRVLKYDGRPLFSEQIASVMLDIRKAKYKGKNREIPIVEKEDLEYYMPNRFGL